MTSSNRASKLESLHKSLKKHFKLVPDPPERTVLEHLLYACCLEDARFEQADEAFAKLQQTYFDWNEVRVTTVAELGDALHSLPFASHAASRIKQCLQALFESRYQYDIDDLKKANLGKAIAELEAWKGITPFVVGYVSQQALGGHSIPVSRLILDALVQCEIITQAEAEKNSVPGLERAIPKNRGVEFGSLLQQFAIELQLHPKSAPVQSVLKDIGVTLKGKAKAPEPERLTPSSKTAAKTESTTLGKKSDPPRQEIEKGKAQKQAPGAKTSETKESGSKDNRKPVVAKKMTPPGPISSSAVDKEHGAKKPPREHKKKGDAASKEVGKKPASSKSETEDAKAKSSSIAKATPSKNKPPSKPNTKKGTTPGKTSGGSVASIITKKKPK
jgi:endonuclease III